ncbi:MAG: hypothetical protein KDC35_03160 [Acidobacteria bacterium]|nr:hypothetical protein [Acidobacteriota bacterium]
MQMRIVVLLLGAHIVALSQLPDRDELIAKLNDPAASQQAFQDLVVHYQLGGVRSILRNLNQLPAETRIAYGRALMHLDLFRYRNDLNANLTETNDPESKALYLQMLATFGRQLESSVFEPYINNEQEDIRVRLAAVSGTIKIQNPVFYEKFYEIAKDAEYDPETGQDDFAFADIDMSNQGFYYFTRGKLAADDVSDAHILTAIRMADKQSTELYTMLLDLKSKKIVPKMIDRAVRVGGVALLEVMEGHKTAKKMLDEIKKAKTAAAAMAKYQSLDVSNAESYPIVAAVPRTVRGKGAEGMGGGFAVIKVAEDGTATVMEHMNPFGGSDEIKALAGRTFVPAMLNFKAVESFVFVTAP